MNFINPITSVFQWRVPGTEHVFLYLRGGGIAFIPDKAAPPHKAREDYATWAIAAAGLRPTLFFVQFHPETRGWKLYRKDLLLADITSHQFATDVVRNGRPFLKVTQIQRYIQRYKEANKMLPGECITTANFETFRG